MLPRVLGPGHHILLPQGGEEFLGIFLTSFIREQTIWG